MIAAAAAAACALLTTAEVAAVVKAPVREARPSRRDDVTQCVYLAEPFSRSVSVELGENARAKWDEAFHGKEGHEEERTGRPRRVPRLGDEAFWLPSQASGVLFVLRKNTLLRISVGGPETDLQKQRRSIRLAQKALRRI
jgi:hypothetical protein